MDIPHIYKLFQETSFVSTDTRTVKEGAFFFALKGANFDGNKFAKEALEKGAKYVVIDNCKYKEDDIHYICVDDVLHSLQQLAEYHRLQLKIPVIGITGTNGKTTTKELIKQVLSAKFKVSATIGNLNNHIGVPLTLLSITSDIEIAIVEMGASKQGDIKELCDIAHPSMGIITNIGVAHIEGFGSLETIFKTKTELFDAVAKNNGDLFINNNIKGIEQKYSSVAVSKKHFYGTKKSVFGKVLSANPFLKVKIQAGKQNTIIQSNLIGGYNLENILAAYTIGRYFSIDIATIKRSLESYEPNLNRSQYIKTKSNEVIADAYNANPSSMEVALLNFFAIDSAKEKVLILGDMLELGTATEPAHKEIVSLIKNHISEINRVYLVGTVFSQLFQNNEKIKVFSNVAELIGYLKSNPLRQKLILLKGSRGIALEKLMPEL